MFYLIDKPKNLSSFDVIRKLRKILNTKKIGHTGTLDPLASGCLLIATGNSTKLIPFLENTFKRYSFTVNFNGKTDSFDMGTPILDTDSSLMLSKDSEEICNFLQKQSKQIPPKYSALHINGKRAYELVRDGHEFEMKERNIVIRDVNIVDYSLPSSLSIELTISSGGYIRSLAPLLGGFLGVSGGYITELRRKNIFLTSGYCLSESDATSIESPVALPYTMIFSNIHHIDIDMTIYEALRNGKIIETLNADNIQEGDLVFLNYQNIFTSLCKYECGSYRIIRNNV